MSCITVSSLSYTSGRAIVVNVATSLGYALVEQGVFVEASSASGIPEERLLQAFREPPTFFGMSADARKRAIAHVSAVLARHFLNDNVVYHGPFGHVLVPGVSHVLKVRVFAYREDRVATRLEREKSLSEEAANKTILREDEQHAKLGKQVFGVDEDNAELYDLVINTSQVDEDTAVELIVNTVKLQRYRAMTYSIRCMRNLELALRTRARLVEFDPDVDVGAENGDVRVRTRARSEGKQRTMRERVAALEGVSNVAIEFVEDSLKRF